MDKILGDMYYFGYSVERNYQKAMELFQKSAMQKNTSALNNVGIMYQYGLGVEKDNEKALEYFEKSALQKNPNARLRSRYESMKDYTNAFKWYEEALKADIMTAGFKLGRMYDNGIGVTT